MSGVLTSIPESVEVLRSKLVKVALDRSAGFKPLLYLCGVPTRPVLLSVSPTPVSLGSSLGVTSPPTGLLPSNTLSPASLLLSVLVDKLAVSKSCRASSGSGKPFSWACAAACWRSSPDSVCWSSWELLWISKWVACNWLRTSIPGMLSMGAHVGR